LEFQAEILGTPSERINFNSSASGSKINKNLTPSINPTLLGTWEIVSEKYQQKFHGKSLNRTLKLPRNYCMKIAQHDENSKVTLY
jgi:hypothetical protein